MNSSKKVHQLLRNLVNLGKKTVGYSNNNINASIERVQQLLGMENNTISLKKSSVSPPSSVYGMKVLNKDSFKTNITVPCIKVNNENIAEKLKLFKPYLLKLQQFKAVRDCGNGSCKCVIFNPDFISSYDDLKENIPEKLENLGVNEDCFNRLNLDITYDNWSAGIIFKAVLPSDSEGFSGYTMIGHVCHVNLRDHLLDYRLLIGQVLLDKINNAKSVVNKTDTIDSTYRNFKMEVLAGSDDMMVTVKENNCSFSFDFTKVYWNSRLCTEHSRIIDKIDSNDVVYDAFAGVGPFSIPAAKKKCQVLANDLNPESYKALVTNVKLNRVEKYVIASNKDGRDFIAVDVKQNLLRCWQNELKDSDVKPSYHIIMNLPAIAIDFTDIFIGLFHGENILEDIFIPPIVYCYCFSKSDDAVADAETMISKVLGSEIINSIEDIFFVRQVAPNKKMMRLTFKLPYSLLFSKTETFKEPDEKRMKI